MEPLRDQSPRSSHAPGHTTYKEVWWLSPATVFACCVVPLGILAYLVNDYVYIKQWHSEKYFDLTALYMTLGSVVAFCSGHLLAVSTFRTTGTVNIPGPVIAKTLLNWFRLGLFATLFGYSVWFLTAVSRGASLSLARSVLRGDFGAMDTVREVAKTMPGVTTCTEFGMAAAIFAAILLVMGYGRKVRMPLWLLVGLSLFRAFFYQERLAFLEIAVPVSVILVAFHPKLEFFRKFKLVPLLACLVVFALFASFEYFRSWSNYYAGGSKTMLQFAEGRFFGYYITALNNGYLAYLKLGVLDFPTACLDWLWRFPQMKFFFPDQVRYVLLQDSFYEVLLRHSANEEFNNLSGIFSYYQDFGLVGGLIFWAAAGFTAGRLYRSFWTGGIAGLLFYPFIFMGILEIPRICYWTAARTLPSWVLLFAIFIRFHALSSQYASACYSRAKSVRNDTAPRNRLLANPSRFRTEST